MKDENEDVRRMAPVALGMTGEVKAREYRSQALTDESETLREIAKAELRLSEKFMTVDFSTVTKLMIKAEESKKNKITNS
ncbi:MAG: HEAT repeat domain-containing protein [Candidatus Methanoperedens sp.]